MKYPLIIIFFSGKKLVSKSAPMLWLHRLVLHACSITLNTSFWEGYYNYF